MDHIINKTTNLNKTTNGYSSLVHRDVVRLKTVSRLGSKSLNRVLKSIPGCYWIAKIANLSLLFRNCRVENKSTVGVLVCRKE